MNEGKKLEERVFALVAQAVRSVVDKETIAPESSLRWDLGLDSLRLASFLFRCGEELGIDPNDFIEVIAGERIRTIGDVVAVGVKILIRSGGAAPALDGQPR